MEVTFYGVRGTIPAPGPGTVRYGGNTSCVAVRLSTGELLILDCGTGARNLGLALMSGEFGRGQGRATVLLSHAHWDHIQGFPFFVPFYVPGNHFDIYGPSIGRTRLDEILEGQMAAQYFPVQSYRNMGGVLNMKTIEPGRVISVGKAKVRAEVNPHGPRHAALALRIEDGGRSLVYAPDAGYEPSGPSPAVLALYADADLLIHDSTFTPEDRQARLARGLSSLVEAIDAAVRSRARRLALFHYDQDYSDHDVDQLVERGRRMVAEAGGRTEVIGAAEGLSLRL